MEILTCYNEPVNILDGVRDNIILIQQYFIHDNKKRHNENLKCLNENINNQYISKIYLLNEKIYNDDEMDNIVSDKIEQVNINKRLTYKDFFDFCKNKALEGYIILSNSDIYFNSTLKNIYTTPLSKNKSCYIQLRLDFPKLNIFGPRKDSQDAWLFHSINIPSGEKYNFYLGKPGCDNKIAYLLYKDGYKLYNEPYRIETIHVHNTGIRNYTRNDIIPKPYVHVLPHMSSYHGNVKQLTNIEFYEYLHNKVINNEPFYIPRVAGIEHYISFCMLEDKIINNTDIFQMQRNAGIRINNLKEYELYREMYVKSIVNSTLYINWENNTDVARAYNVIRITNKLIRKPKLFSAKLIAPYNSILNKDIHFTHAFKGKRILVINPFINSIKKQLSKKMELFGGYELFPDCSFIFVKPPQTNGLSKDNNGWFKHFIELCKKIRNVKEDFDIAICSCGGYGNLITHYIYKSLGKSAIYMGGILQLYFGVIGNRWIRNPNIELITQKYHTQWIRPSDEEKPDGYSQVEGGCYW